MRGVSTALGCGYTVKCSEHITDKERLGYLYWHDRAKSAYAKGQRQRKCSECHKWIFPFEMRDVYSSADEAG